MELCNEIVRLRGCGKVRCGIREHSVVPSVSAVARSFELFEDAACYTEVTFTQALAILTRILHRDMAYGSELMAPGVAATLASSFLEQTSSPACSYFSNGDFFEESSSHGWNPATQATFDTGVLVVGVERAGCLWVEDED